jgi:hypothetical protein
MIEQDRLAGLISPCLVSDQPSVGQFELLHRRRS